MSFFPFLAFPCISSSFPTFHHRMAYVLLNLDTVFGGDPPDTLISTPLPRPIIVSQRKFYDHCQLAISATILQPTISSIFITADMLVFVLSLAWNILSTIQGNLKNDIFDVVFPDEASLTQTASSLSLVLATTLFEVLLSEDPPTIEFFKTLPTCSPLDRVWAVYLLVLEKNGHESKIYIGCGTEAKQGVSSRLRYHTVGCSVPRYVEKALNSDYHVSHKGLLCTIPIPTRPQQATIRAFFLLLETTFAFAVWGMYASKADYKMSLICPWEPASLEYRGLCSHTSLMEEIPGD